MKKIYLFLLVALFAIELSAQELTVLSFEPQPTDLTAKIGNRKDLNGDICGAVRVQIAAPNVLFSGNVIGEVETRFGEYVVFLAKNTRHLRIYHKDYIFTPLDYEIPLKIESNKTYLLKLEVPVYTHYNDIMLERDKRKRPQYGFEQHIEVGYKLEANEYVEVMSRWGGIYNEKPLYTFSLSWIGGRRFNNTFYLGGGLNFGLSKCEYWSDSVVYYEIPTETGISGSVFVNGRAYLSKTRFSPFIALSAGMSIFSKPEVAFKPYLNPEFGVNYRIKEHFSIYLTAGYATQFGYFDAWQFKLGFTL